MRSSTCFPLMADGQVVRPLLLRRHRSPEANGASMGLSWICNEPSVHWPPRFSSCHRSPCVFLNSIVASMGRCCGAVVSWRLTPLAQSCPWSWSRGAPLLAARGHSPTAARCRLVPGRNRLRDPVGSYHGTRRGTRWRRPVWHLRDPVPFHIVLHPRNPKSGLASQSVPPWKVQAKASRPSPRRSFDRDCQAKAWRSPWAGPW